MRSALVLAAAVLLLASCGDRQAATGAVRQTGLPGMETAGGLTSGEAMAAVASSAPVSPGPAASAALSPASAALPPASAALSPASAAALEAKQEGLALEQAEDRIAARLATPAAGTKP